VTPAPDESENVEAVNESAKPLWLALPPREAARLALQLAAEADGTVQALSDERLAKMRATGIPPFQRLLLPGLLAAVRHPLPPRACYALWAIMITKRWSSTMAKARKCQPCRVSDKRS